MLNICPHLHNILNRTLVDIKRVRRVFPKLDTMSVSDIDVYHLESPYGFAELSWAKLVSMKAPSHFLEIILYAKLVLSCHRGYYEDMPVVFGQPKWVAVGDLHFFSAMVMFKFDPNNPILSEYMITIRHMPPNIMYLLDKQKFRQMLISQRNDCIKEFRKIMMKYPKQLWEFTQ